MNDESNSACRGRDERPLSPCVLICTLDEDRICLGCGRSLEQISRWALLDKDEQWAIVDQLSATAAAD
ncbi:MAG: DUF1289 domain-containing protein [Gammaproteobacteria bacterium]|nr:DUF1289 domain-containing protein [Gammaproteobacteria bacterium]MBT8110277.1 DUF1289 domain-containing protein [Gammaproteobacteria bacterium]NND48197.1 DUF1289 domain-containing protein [Woeseiaceae bacterium]NNL44980.1 DUF1289 domain-containing protein [Woeseiaceae bacterium]